MIDKFQKHLYAERHCRDRLIKQTGDGHVYVFSTGITITTTVGVRVINLEVKPKLLLKMWKLL